MSLNFGGTPAISGSAPVGAGEIATIKTTIGIPNISDTSAPNLVLGSHQITTDLVPVTGTTLTLDPAAHAGRELRFTSNSAITVTVPTTFVGGCMIQNAGTGTLTLVAGSGVTLLGNLVLQGPQLAVSLLPSGASNTWDVLGAGSYIGSFSFRINPPAGGAALVNGTSIVIPKVQIPDMTFLEVFCAQLDAGSLSFQLKIGTTAVGGGANSCTNTSDSTVTVSSANVAGPTDRINGTISSVTGSPTALVVSVKFSRAKLS